MGNRKVGQCTFLIPLTYFSVFHNAVFKEDVGRGFIEKGYLSKT